MAADTSVATAATITPPLALTSVRVRVKMPDVVPAGDRAGLVVSSPTGMNQGALSAVTISTYMGTSTRARQEFDLGSVLNQVAASNGPARVEFAVTTSFDRLEVRAGGLLNAGYSVNLHHVYSYGTSVPLPVQLMSFQGKVQDGTAALTWQTATEYNSRAFVVERATTPEAGSFRPLAEVPSTGTASRGQQYRYHDAGAGQYGAGTRLYYRLRQQDQDGTETFSPVVVLTVPAAAEVPFTLWPNPVSSTTAAEVLVKLANPAATGELLLYNAQGRQVLRQPLSATPSVPVGALAPGLYVAAVVDAAGHRLGQQRLWVQP